MKYGTKIQESKMTLFILPRDGKRFIAGFLMALFHLQMWGADQPQFTEGAQLYVMANSGLTLRSQPTTNSESLAIVDFGASVKVLSQTDSISTYQKINWVEGTWIFVDYDGVTGYMFDGYLSDLPLPTYEFEKCHLDMDLIYPLESWADINLDYLQSDTILAGALTKVTDIYEAGDKIIKTQRNEEYKIELYLKDIRLMDAYHLLITMLDGDKAIETFKELSTFIEDRDDELYKILIDLDNPVRIRKLKNGDVKITIQSLDYICGL